MPILAWTSAQYLGHKNLQDTLTYIKRGRENVALSPTGFIIYPDTQSGTGGLGASLRVVQTFVYRIDDDVYIRGVGLTSAATIAGDRTCTLIPHDSADNTASGGYDIPATYYRAGVLLVDSTGAFSVKMGAMAGAVHGVKAAGRAKALSLLVDALEPADLAGKAIVAFYAVGDGTNLFVSTTSMTIDTSVDIYNCGGMALSTGVSTDGNQLLALL